MCILNQQTLFLRKTKFLIEALIFSQFDSIINKLTRLVFLYTVYIHISCNVGVIKMTNLVALS